MSVIASLVLIFFTGCAGTDRSASRSSNENAQTKSDLPSGGDIIEIDPYESADAYCGDLVKKITGKLALTQLPKKVGGEEYELRIWSNLGGLVDPMLLGIHPKGGEDRAYFFVIDRGTDQIKSRRERLQSPKSGWNRMLFEMRSRLTTPKGLARDPKFDLMRDEPVILLEVLDRGEYRRVLYGQKTSFADGKRLIEVCEYLASQFDVEMECRRTP
ncbi:MAG TPA: hypothetical protein VGO43_04640 [Pyrinomonadaceae bacterium]|jgi:hypothetical protein|nr:hypothetical protein [Pyrinomonadaceae bacterium]